MRGLLAFAALALLSSCFIAADIGAYWAKGYLDPALEGTWDYVDEKPYNGAKKWTFTRADDVYKVDGYVNDTSLATAHPMDMRTLRVGKYTYAMAKLEKGEWALMRYEVSGKNAKEFLPNKEALIGWIKQNRPNAKNLELTQDSPQDIKIKTLDEETFLLLADFPSGDDYWDSFLFRKARR